MGYIAMVINGNSKRIATIGGTFDVLHHGHKEYIKLAFDFSDYLIIFVSTDKYLKGKKKYSVKPYKDRLKKLMEFIHQLGYQNRYEVRKHKRKNDFKKIYLQTFTKKNTMYMAIVSPEYYKRFIKINRAREKKGMNSILLIVKPRLYENLSNGKRVDISSTAIRNGNCKHSHSLKNEETPIP